MTGFLLDENLPNSLRFTPSLSVKHVRDLGQSLADTSIWSYAKENNLVIITKDANFSERMLISEPPPKVWPRIEELLMTNKLINIYADRLEAVAQRKEDSV